MTETVEKLQQENFDLKIRVFHLEDELGRCKSSGSLDLTTKFENLQSEVEQKEDLLLKAKEAVDELKDEVEGLREENTTLKEQLYDKSEDSRLQAELKALRDQKARLAADLALVKERETEHVREIEALQRKVETMHDDMRRRTVVMEERERHRQSQISSLTAEISRLEKNAVLESTGREGASQCSVVPNNTTHTPVESPRAPGISQNGSDVETETVASPSRLDRMVTAAVSESVRRVLHLCARLSTTSKQISSGVAAEAAHKTQTSEKKPSKQGTLEKVRAFLDDSDESDSDDSFPGGPSDNSGANGRRTGSTPTSPQRTSPRSLQDVLQRGLEELEKIERDTMRIAEELQDDVKNPSAEPEDECVPISPGRNDKSRVFDLEKNVRLLRRQLEVEKASHEEQWQDMIWVFEKLSAELEQARSQNNERAVRAGAASVDEKKRLEQEWKWRLDDLRKSHLQYTELLRTDMEEINLELDRERMDAVLRLRSLRQRGELSDTALNVLQALVTQLTRPRPLPNLAQPDRRAVLSTPASTPLNMTIG
eukprot:Rmarinus@m.27428